MSAAHQTTPPDDPERLARMHAAAFDAAVDAQAEVRRLRATLAEIALMANRLPGAAICHDIHNAAVAALVFGRADVMQDQTARPYMGQIMAECDCSQQAGELGHDRETGKHPCAP